MLTNDIKGIIKFRNRPPNIMKYESCTFLARERTLPQIITSNCAVPNFIKQPFPLLARSLIMQMVSIKVYEGSVLRVATGTAPETNQTEEMEMEQES